MLESLMTKWGRPTKLGEGLRIARNMWGTHMAARQNLINYESAFMRGFASFADKFSGFLYYMRQCRLVLMHGCDGFDAPNNRFYWAWYFVKKAMKAVKENGHYVVPNV